MPAPKRALPGCRDVCIQDGTDLNRTLDHDRSHRRDLADCSYGNENREVDEHRAIPLRIAGISDAPIKESELKNDWPPGRRPDALR
jgi:hypothetical protein